MASAAGSSGGGGAGGGAGAAHSLATAGDARLTSCCDDGLKDCPCWTAEQTRPVPGLPRATGSKKVEIAAGETKYFCMCGKSGNFPFCDGTHVKINEALGTSFRPAPVANETAAPTTINACMCGHSKKRPFCDGSHRKVKPTPVASEFTYVCGDHCSCNTSTTARAPPVPTLTGSMPVTLKAGERKFMCMCGQSANFPFCDGSHKAVNARLGTKFAPKPVSNDSSEDKEVRLCVCGHSQNRPFCDGSHRKVKAATATAKI